ncbi:asparagine synthase (glutamine-hydrolyzing) [Silvanigrella paludirubra]|uniref:asparagine synthase (glutamine-hydrolyzing) n=1 Tax=Silvanigrella paludirubra TaxID=2499159 RepID=A0A6N6VTN3_9BACT|nr:asparagine synthase (glutamine-hydrolyzing) [Silvanigrella paludirubra]KAB8036809.1 asparagine synthase (glutamine-hydrolyzing) [Silvanigrella paludirubra]
MCGIFGIFKRDSKVFKFDSSHLYKSLLHRGPDGQGYLYYNKGRNIKLVNELLDFNSSEVFLAHFRLSILDLSDSGRQPMPCNDKRFYITFNGEIYNYIEIREELKVLGYEFQSNSDTEVLLNAYKEWGKDCLLKLNGMFAFCIFDSQERKLLLARDYFGIKPLFFYFDKDSFVFASEIKAILSVLESKPSINHQVVQTYLQYGKVENTKNTFFNNIYKIDPSSYLEIEMDKYNENSVQFIKYWNLEIKPEIKISRKDAEEELRSIFVENIKLHLRSDVPVGSCLSGGIDSSAIVSVMRYLEPKLEIHTFSFVPNNEKLSEAKWIDIVNKKVKAIPHLISPDQNDLIIDFDKIIIAQDEPFASSSIFAQYQIMKLAKENNIKVLLDGQGSDEIFAGYPYYSVAKVANFVRNGNLISACRLKNRLSLLPSREISWAQVCSWLLPNYFHNNLIPSIKKLMNKNILSKNWFKEEWFLERNNEKLVYPFEQRNRISKNLFREELALTVKTLNVPELLRYEDRNSMAFSVESRVPFLTKNLVEYGLSLPAEYLLDENGTTKSIFRSALNGIVPSEILERKDKIGFQAPEEIWIKSLKNWVLEILNSETANNIPFLNINIIRQYADNFIENRIHFDSAIWRVLVFIRWSELYSIQYEKN